MSYSRQTQVIQVIFVTKTLHKDCSRCGLARPLGQVSRNTTKKDARVLYVGELERRKGHTIAVTAQRKVGRQRCVSPV